MIDSILKEKCTGCKMCADICPVNAIEYKEDNQGFWYPTVDYDKCINCEKCTKVCPSLNIDKISCGEPPKVYAVWSKDEDTRITSTSGGVFYEVAIRFIENGGVVVGCSYGDDWRSAHHMIAHDKEELLKTIGSKYFQSDTKGIYKAVKKELDDEKKVLFCGTPCQNAAMQMYLGKEYENMFYMDFICRSINSPKAFKAYIDELEQKYKSKVVNVHLKDKTNGWQSLATRVTFENGEYSLRDKNTDWWVRGFIHNDLYTREACYHCQYKVLPRLVADITIGDFWGINNQTEEDMHKGISVVLINSKKGEDLMHNTQDAFVIKQKCIEDAIPGNMALLKNPVRTNKQDKFFLLLEKHGFTYSVKKCVESSMIKKMCKKIIRVARKICGFIKNDRRISRTKYIYYNYFCKSIIRKGNGKIIPYKNAILNIHKSAKVYIGNGDLEIGINKLKGSKAETYVRVQQNAVWNAKGGCLLFYDTVFEIKPNATFTNGFFSANGGSVIITQKETVFGEDVMIGRNVIIYDSDFHNLIDDNDNYYEKTAKVEIGDHVWLTSNITVLKGVKIGKNSIVSGTTVVRKDIPEKSLVGGGSVGKVIGEAVRWSR